MIKTRPTVDKDQPACDRQQRDGEATMEEDYRHSAEDLEGPLTPEEIAGGDSAKLEKVLFDDRDPS